MAYARTSSRPCAQELDLPASEGERRRAAKRIMREAHVEVIDDYIHMGIPLTDGVGWIDPALLSCKEKDKRSRITTSATGDAILMDPGPLSCDGSIKPGCRANGSWTAVLRTSLHF